LENEIGFANTVLNPSGLRTEIATPDRDSGQARNDKEVASLLAMTERASLLTLLSSMGNSVFPKFLIQREDFGISSYQATKPK